MSNSATLEMTTPVQEVAKQDSHTKERITIRIDRDVLEWFRSLSPNARGYQSRINQALRECMQNGLESTEEIMRKVLRDELKKINEESSQES